MNDSPQYEAFRAFARSEIRAARLELKAELAKELKDEFKETLTRESPKVIEGPPGKDGANGIAGKDGQDGKDGIDGKPGERGTDGIIGRDGKDGLNGLDGKPGEKGERGTDGIATRAEQDAWFEQRAADLEARSLADVFQGVYDQSKSYIRGMIAVWDGQPWLAMVETRAVPGVSSDWKLLVKKGRDGRDKSK